MAITKEEIDAANKEVINIINNSKPMLVNVGIAGESIPNMTPTMILHSGPPIDFLHMRDVQKGAVISALIFEGMARDSKEALELISSGKIILDSCHNHSAVEPIAGVISYHMPVFIVTNKTYGNKAYSTFNEGNNEALRFGEYNVKIIERLKWFENNFYKILKEVIKVIGEIDLKSIILESLRMGDDGHCRNNAATSIFLRKIIPGIIKIDFPIEEKIKILKFIDSNNSFFSNVILAAVKSIMDATFYDINQSTKGATIVSLMSGNGYEFGIKVSGLGQNKWYTAPVEKINGKYLNEFSEGDACLYIGDSCIVETIGLGGLCMCSSLETLKLIGMTFEMAIYNSKQMYDITESENIEYENPVLDSRGLPTGIDIRKVIKNQILPTIDTEIVSLNQNIGLIGYGFFKPPIQCFDNALLEYKKMYLL